VTQGAAFTFRVTATGTAPLTYQWRLNGNNLPGGGLPSYTISNVKLANAGAYDVVVSNEAGSDTSDASQLKVLVSAPKFASPFSRPPANFSGTFNSQTGLTYILDFKSALNNANWIPITSNIASGATLTLTDSHPLTNGFYRLRVQ
jgi:hypothetical protein